jgi:hypothetical protein
MNNSPAYFNSTTQIKENVNTVFVKVDDGIYLVDKDRFGNFSGRVYVNTKEVIDELNCNSKVAIFGKNQLGMLSVIHYN